MNPGTNENQNQSKNKQPEKQASWQPNAAKPEGTDQPNMKKDAGQFENRPEEKKAGESSEKEKAA